MNGTPDCTTPAAILDVKTTEPEMHLCLTSACFVGRHTDCTDIAGNCCDCSCHTGVK